jgi:DNA helicase-2/ATP-dependent DNA helicase PcrA
VLAYLRVLDNPEDAVSILRIINVPKRGIGEETVRKLVAFAKQLDISVREALRRIDDISSLNKGMKTKLQGFDKLISELEEETKRLTPAVLTKKVIEKTGLKKALELEGTVEAKERIDNLLEFRFALEEMEEQRPDVTLRDFLQEVTLMTEVDEWKEDKGHVTLMTLHSAKGLEFPVVFVAGVEDGVLPMAGREDRGTDVEEERRLFYVGMTRAMERLYLSYANHRRLFGEGNSQVPSPFLLDIPEDLLEGDYEMSWKVTKLDPASSAGHGYKVDSPFNSPPRSRGKKKYRRGEGKMLQGHIPTSRDKTLENIKKLSVRKGGEIQFKIGERVVHRDFGEGTVLSKSGSANNLLIRVLFKKGGIKTLVANLAPIKKKFES